MAKHKILVFNEAGWERMVTLLGRAGTTAAIATLNANFEATYDDRTERAEIEKNITGANFYNASRKKLFGELNRVLPGKPDGC